MRREISPRQGERYREGETARGQSSRPDERGTRQLRPPGRHGSRRRGLAGLRALGAGMGGRGAAGHRAVRRRARQPERAAPDRAVRPHGPNIRRPLGHDRRRRAQTRRRGRRRVHAGTQHRPDRPGRRMVQHARRGRGRHRFAGWQPLSRRHAGVLRGSAPPSAADSPTKSPSSRPIGDVQRSISSERTATCPSNFLSRA